MATEMKIESKSSIEKEPRTLSMDQIQDAREAALDVLSTKSKEEALCVFTEGLQPAINVDDGKLNMDDKDLSGLDRNFGKLEGLRDIGSAPF